MLLADLEDLPEELREDNPPIGLLASDEDLAEDFCRTDVSVLRVSFWAHQWSPAGFHADLEEVTEEIEEAMEEECFACEEEDEGIACSRIFDMAKVAGAQSESS